MRLLKWIAILFVAYSVVACAAGTNVFLHGMPKVAGVCK